ncbi:chorismate synthase [Candidatus Micrarchaeota archaeon]|nr:chorismate synthase [Candidatus Micrarchaeota archaeon]
MNTIGRLFRVSVLGESHGECVGALIDGVPAGLELKVEDFKTDMERRQGGRSKGTTPRKEADIPIIKSGVFNDKTTGAPLLLLFENANVRSSDYEELKNTPRPGHADLVGTKKFGNNNDYRGGGHFSGRLTAALVAAGVVAKKILKKSKIDTNAQIIEVGGTKEIERAIDEALSEGDSIGGIVECKVKGIPIGIGEPFFDSVESVISHAVFAIPAIKGIEFGSGFGAARMKGSNHNDEILDLEGKTRTNNAGGINGGITNGNELVFRIAVKPTSSIKKTKTTIDLRSGKMVDISVKGRHDACIALRVPVVLEAVTAVAILDLMIIEQKTGRIIE